MGKKATTETCIVFFVMFMLAFGLTSLIALRQ